MEKLKKTISNLPEEVDLHKQAEVLKALSDPTRLKILYLLVDGERCVCEIILALEKPQSTISHHLNVLKNAGFIKWRKEGVWMHYRLLNPDIITLIRNLTELFKEMV
jgi:DNA-binding transcriptional ArsR family regulator